METKIKDDAALIERLGGPAELARRLGFPDTKGTQRVHNWKSRGIPVRVKYERPDIFQNSAEAEQKAEAA